jgi:hypothetical protein
MDMKNISMQLPAEPSAQINYISTLASLENYQLPTLPAMSVQEMISEKIFNWYHGMSEFEREMRLGYFNNYE